MCGTLSVLMWHPVPHPGPGPGQLWEQGDSEASLTEHRAAVMNRAFLASMVTRPAATCLESRTLITNRTQGPLWPCERGAQVPRDEGTQASARPFFLAALWRHLLGTVQSASAYKLAWRKQGLDSASDGGSQTSHAPPGGAEGECLPGCRGPSGAQPLGQLHSCRIQDLTHTSIIKLPGPGYPGRN